MGDQFAVENWPLVLTKFNAVQFGKVIGKCPFHPQCELQQLNVDYQ